MQYVLVVVIPFGEYQKGDEISDDEKVKELIGSEFENHFIKRQK